MTQQPALDSVEVFLGLKCPKCGGELLLEETSYTDDGTTYISISLKCYKCGSRYMFPYPFIEVR